jgi:hypothetical protein
VVHLTSRERRRYPRYPCSAAIQVSWIGAESGNVVGECVEVCRNGMRIVVMEQIPVKAPVGLRAEGLGISGNGTVRYCRRQRSNYVTGVEFIGGMQWSAPSQPAHGATLTSGMTSRTSSIFESLLAGMAAHELQPSISQLSFEEREALLCTVSCIRTAVAENCQERAELIDLVLKNNGRPLPPRLLPMS